MTIVTQQQFDEVVEIAIKAKNKAQKETELDHKKLAQQALVKTSKADQIMANLKWENLTQEEAHAIRESANVVAAIEKDLKILDSQFEPFSEFDKQTEISNDDDKAQFIRAMTTLKRQITLGNTLSAFDKNVKTIQEISKSYLELYIQDAIPLKELIGYINVTLNTNYQPIHDQQKKADRTSCSMM